MIKGILYITYIHIKKEILYKIKVYIIGIYKKRNTYQIYYQIEAI